MAVPIHRFFYYGHLYVEVSTSNVVTGFYLHHLSAAFEFVHEGAGCECFSVFVTISAIKIWVSWFLFNFPERLLQPGADWPTAHDTVLFNIRNIAFEILASWGSSLIDNVEWEGGDQLLELLFFSNKKLKYSGFPVQA